MIRRKQDRDYIYAIPFGALILFTNINFATGDDNPGSGGGGAFTLYIRLAIYALALYPFIVKPQVHFPWLVKRWPFLLMLVYVPASLLWSAYPSGVIESSIHLVGGALGAFTASIYFYKHHDRIFAYFSIIFAIPVLVSLATVFALPDIGLQNFQWEEVVRWRGATGNANTLGRISAIAIWVNTISLLNNWENKKHRVFHIAIIGASIITLIGSDSKTSLALALLLVALVFLLPQILGRNTKKKKKIKVLLGYLLLVLVSFSLIFSNSFSPDKQAALSKVGRDNTYSGRTYIWEDASALINMKPITGWSFDGRRSAFDEIDIGVPHFHNGYLDFLVRGGMAGFLILMALITRTAWRVYRKSRSRPHVYPHLAAFLLIILIYNLSEVSFGAWSDSMWTMLLFIYFMAERSSRRRRRNSRSHASFTIKTEETNGLLKRLQLLLKKRAVYSSLILMVLAGVLSITILNGQGNTPPARHLNTSEASTNEADNQKWRGIIFAPEYKSESEDYIKKFESLVTEALSPLGINLIIFDMHWSNYRFTGIPGLTPLDNPPFGVVTASDAKKMADICRENGIQVMVGMNFLTHQSFGQLLKAFPQYQWPGNEKLWNPLNTKVNEIAFKMADELIESFGAEGFHVGMDEGWGFNVENLPEAKSHSTAELFAKAINEYHDHFVKEKGIEMMMWSDMLEERYDDAPVGDAISMIPKDIILMSWDYECHWKRYPGLGRFIEKFIPVCPWDSKWPAKLADKGFRVMVSPWKNPRASEALAESTTRIRNDKFKGILYTTWSPQVVYDLKDALLNKHTKRSIDPTIIGIAKSINKTIEIKTLQD
ncbi:MAG: hypothetical protein DSZ28_00635 [Thiothrix sp.]|nr:MAG: hypothetical protein DSZ28_00635 [Thiothrix sp.]